MRHPLPSRLSSPRTGDVPLAHPIQNKAWGLAKDCIDYESFVTCFRAPTSRTWGYTTYANNDAAVDVAVNTNG